MIAISTDRSNFETRWGRQDLGRRTSRKGFSTKRGRYTKRHRPGETAVKSSDDEPNIRAIIDAEGIIVL